MTEPSLRKPQLNFNLQKMELIYEQALGKADEPHRHDYFTVLFVEEAKGQHIVDYISYTFGEKQVYFVGPGQVHQVDLSQKPKGWVITFSRAFLMENNIPEDFITNLNLFRTFGENPPLDIDLETFPRLCQIILEMEKCLPEGLIYRNRALGALLQLFLIYCNNSQLLDTTQLDEEDSRVCLLRDFKNLLEREYQNWHKVITYASELNLTSKHLSQTVKNLTGKTAKEFIQDRLILEAKRLLLHTDMSVKEIAYAIGFEEPLHFSAFYKKHTGQSPSEFKTHKAF